jgi:proline dehydrogenase
MLRSTLIYLSKAEWVRQIVTNWRLSWRAVSRFVAGEKLEDAIKAVEKLNSIGINATIDHLGENTTTPEEARRAAKTIEGILETIQESGVRSGVSIKLTQIGLALDEQMCAENLRQILEVARRCKSYVRIDMEDSPFVEATLRVYRDMCDKYGFTNTGVVIQSYLYRSEEDIRLLSVNGTTVRLCKGAYKEPPEVAFPKKGDVDSNFDILTKMLIDKSISVGSPEISADGKFPPLPAIASHDPDRLAFAKAYANKVKLPKTAIEFQMLYGIRRDLQRQTILEGYPVRVYVPYGTEWYPYFMRRLAERPANLWFFISNFFRK